MKRKIYKKRFLKFYLIVTTVICGVLLQSVTVKAAPSLANLPGIKVINNKTGEATDGSTISGEYSTQLRISQDMYYSFRGTTNDANNNKNYAQANGANSVRFNKNIMSSTPNKNSSVRLNRVAIYQGEYIDLRINLGYKNGNNSSTGDVQLYVPSYKSTKKQQDDNFLHFRNGGGGKNTDIYFEYEFLKSGTEVRVSDYKGMWNYRRVNSYKSVTVNANTSHQLYVYDNTSIQYSTNLNQITAIGTNGAAETPDTNFTNLLDLRYGVFYTTMTTLKSSTSYFKYELDPITKLELPYPEIMGHTNEDPKSNQVAYTVIQDMPIQAKPNFYPTSYVLFVTLDKAVDINNIQYNVKDIQGKTVSNAFDLAYRSPETNQIGFIVNSGLLSSAGFVDNSYRINISGQVKSDVKKSEYYNNGYYVFPASTYYKTNTNYSDSRKADARLKARVTATPKEQTVAQYSSTTDWSKYDVTDLFTDFDGAFEGDEVEISNIQSKVFSNKGQDSVEVTLKGKSSQLTATFTVPVKVLEQRKAHIHYVDEKGKEVANVVEKTGFETQTYDYTDEIRDITNYKFVKVDETKGSSIKGEFNNGLDIDVYLIYLLDKQKVTVNHVDETGKVIAKESITEYDSNSEQTVNSLKVPGFEVTSAKVNDSKQSLSPDGSLKISVEDKPLIVTFTYKSVHFDLKLTADTTGVSQREDIAYTLQVSSGMKYSAEMIKDNYTNVNLSISVDPKLKDIRDIKVINSQNQVIGVGQYTPETNAIKVSLTESVVNSDDFKVRYIATVKEDAKTEDVIETKANMTAYYIVNGESVPISRQSNEVKTPILGGLSLISAPKTIDFGKVTYQAKNMTVDNPSIDDRLVVSDTRAKATDGWTLSATLASPLMSNGEELAGKVIYKTGDSELELSSNSQNIYVQKQENQSKVDVTDTWGTTPQSDGIKLKFKAKDELKAGSYEGKIRWTLMAGQP
ncbi:MucBP domain-containing protein [Vagococcus hydrophili]|uniref:WxL domain-containing protein n=1 Tax=Vagococcus hydrophili TaxID=2714947 RepID=A0A6G8ARF3_9ENTE|nr:MucBP domain-containing protein [Vagococcus hydrophili]QIL47505.1 hypothetical protein G7082_02630 [Vagococcus hydrophili]